MRPRVGWTHNTPNWLNLPLSTVQVVDRALVVDVLQNSLQPAGNVWAANTLGAGGVSVFFVFFPIGITSALPIKNWIAGEYRPTAPLPRLGGTQIKIPIIFNTSPLLFTYAITAWCVDEEPFVNWWVIKLSLADTSTQPITRLGIQLLRKEFLD